MEEWSITQEFKHSVGILNIYVDASGSRLIFLDTKAQAYVYHAVNLIHIINLFIFLSENVLGNQRMSAHIRDSRKNYRSHMGQLSNRKEYIYYVQ